MIKRAMLQDTLGKSVDAEDGHQRAQGLGIGYLKEAVFISDIPCADCAAMLMLTQCDRLTDLDPDSESNLTQTTCQS